MDTTYAEILEAVYQAYEKSLDIDVALSLVPMSSTVRVQLLDDPDLTARMTLCDSRVKEALVTQVRSLADSAVSEVVRLQALKELGRTLYPKRFKDGSGSTALVKLRRTKAPDEWPEDYVNIVKEDMQTYIDESDFPTEAEFCYTRGIGIKKVDQHLKDMKELMAAKRQAMMIRRGWSGDDPLGTFLTKLAANAGPFSLVDKHEIGGPDGDPIAINIIKRVVVDG